MNFQANIQEHLSQNGIDAKNLNTFLQDLIQKLKVKIIEIEGGGLTDANQMYEYFETQSFIDDLENFTKRL
jgi:hypothetical protein